MIFACNASNARSTLFVGRLLAALTLAVGALGFGGCTSLSVERDFATIAAMAPAPVVVDQGKELRAAEAAASRIEGAQAFRGIGDSMTPLYVSGTAIVAVPCDYHQLQVGMTVVYVNRNGRGVAHVLVNEMPGGWIAQGVNNRSEDADLVTAGNLVGVVTQAYASADTPMRRAIANRLTKPARPQLALNLTGAGAAGSALAVASTN